MNVKIASMTEHFKPATLADWEKAAAKSAPGGGVDYLCHQPKWCRGIAS